MKTTIGNENDNGHKATLPPEDITSRLGGLGLGTALAPVRQEMEAYSVPPYWFAERNPDGSTSPVSDTVVEKVRTELLRRRQAILDLPSQESGLNMERVNAYRQTIGAPNKPIRILAPADYALALRIADISDSNEPMPGQGEFIALLDVVLVERDAEEEESYGPGTTESKLIHEIAHSSGRSPEVELEIEIEQPDQKRKFGARKNAPKTKITNIYSARSGFFTINGQQTRGLLLEELYAEFERGQYVANDLDLPDGFIEDRQTGHGAILNKYAFPTAHKNGLRSGVLAPGSMGAGVLELLVNHDPELLDLIRDYRQSPSELDAIIGNRINGIIPGLYDEMLALDIDDPGVQRQAATMFVRTYQQLQS